MEFRLSKTQTCKLKLSALRVFKIQETFKIFSTVAFFFRSLMFLSYSYICLFYLFISTYKTTFTNWLITPWEMFVRQLDSWYKVEATPCDRNVVVRTSLVVRQGWNNSWTSIVCAFMKRMVQVNIKKTKTSKFCEKCNAYVCKNCFEQYHTRSQLKRKYYMIYK